VSVFWHMVAQLLGALSVRLWGVIDLQLVEVSLIDDCNCNPP